jgi:tRNA threonylcarbamoyladenosine biosynthesis protein TsaB
VILALETATAACSTALATPTGELLAERVELEGPAHTRVLLPQVHAVLGEAGVDIASVETVLVGLGPGAFTGLRIGVATARGLALAGETRLGGVPTLTALALALSAAAESEGADRFVPLVDARRRELFAACYERDGGGVRPCSGLAVVPGAELDGYLAQFPGAVAGGDGAVLYAASLPGATVTAGAVVAPTAAMIARAWVSDVPDRREGMDAVLPIYGREPDAVRWSERRPA